MNNLQQTIEEQKNLFKDLERKTERGMWWVRLDRVEEENERYMTQLIKAVVEMIDEKEKRYRMIHISDTQSVASNEFYRQKVNAVNRKINDILSDIKQNLLSIIEDLQT